DAQLIGRVIERVVADIVVLDVDAIQGHIRIRRSQTVDHGGGIAVGNHSGLRLQNAEDVAVQDGKVLDLLHAHRVGNFGAGGVHALNFRGNVHGLGDGGQLKLDLRHGSFARGVDGDAAQRGFHEAGGLDREVVVRGTDGDEVVRAVGRGFGGE